jgi:hypothetical protein
MSTKVLEALDRALGSSAEPDDVLRETVRLLTEEPGVSWAAIAFLERGELAHGPAAGIPDESRRRRVPILFQGTPVGELWVDGDADAEFLDRVASRLAGHVLIGWDTGGEAWVP